MSISQAISVFFNNNTSVRYTATSPAGQKMRFKFRYIYDTSASSWRAYIVKSPDYGYKATDLHATHRYYDESRRMYYICWTQPLSKYADIVEISEVWARETAKYIETGERF